MAGSAVPTLSVAVAPRRRACVLDTSLALSPYGLLLAQRLSPEVELWLVRELWRILDNIEAYVDEPDLLLPLTPTSADDEARAHGERRVLLQTAIQQWDIARTERDLAGLNVFWIGDGLSDSLLPSGNVPHVVSRFDLLGRALDTLASQNGDAQCVSALSGCVRDAAALAVALSSCGAFILTVRPARPGVDDGGGEPTLCRLLGQWGIQCSRVDGRHSASVARTYFEPLVSRAGIAELIWAGLDPAVVHVVAPRAAAIPTFGATTSVDDDELTDEALDAQLWDGAVGFWYPLVGD
jgi:hypothetical protein